MTGEAAPAGAMVCANCGRSYGDRLYHGPLGHAPQNLCLDCWANEWGRMEARMLNGGQWTSLDSALWLVCCGLTRQQAASVLGLHRNTLHNWFLQLRKHPERIPRWLVHKASLAGET